MRFLPRVDGAMLFDFHGPSEWLLADAALVRFLPGVDEAVHVEYVVIEIYVHIKLHFYQLKLV